MLLFLIKQLVNETCFVKHYYYFFNQIKMLLDSLNLFLKIKQLHFISFRTTGLVFCLLKMSIEGWILCFQKNEKQKTKIKFKIAVHICNIYLCIYMKCSRQILPQHWSVVIANCHIASMVIVFYWKLIAATRKLIVIFDGRMISLLFTRNTVIYVILQVWK